MAKKTEFITDVEDLAIFGTQVFIIDFFNWIMENGSAVLEDEELTLLEDYYNTYHADIPAGLPEEIEGLLYKAANDDIRHPFVLSTRILRRMKSRRPPMEIRV
jgi:hypothetical protein